MTTFTLKLVDIKDMPSYNPKVKNQIDSVSTGKVYLTSKGYVYCKKHGAMLTVDGNIYRCPACHVGAYLFKGGKS